MYDKEFSKHNTAENDTNDPIKFIRSSFQDDIIKEKSQELWNRIENGLFNNIPNCSTKQADQIKNLFEALVLLFKKRLDSGVSEPRAVTFSVSGRSQLSKDKLEELEELLRIAKEAQLLYDRVSTGKDDGKREIYYVPNRLLFPIRGLDVVGQHARVSIKALELYNAAVNKKALKENEFAITKTLFDNEN